MDFLLGDKVHIRNLTLLLIVSVGLTAHSATEKPCTTEPASKWMSREVVRAKVRALDYRIADFEIENGCYVVEVRDRDGKEIALYIDPVNGRIIRSEKEP